MNIGELITCMLVAVILLAAVFVGGNAMINSANLTVAQNDMRSFEVAARQRKGFPKMLAFLGKGSAAKR